MRKYEEYEELLESINSNIKKINEIMKKQKEVEEKSIAELPKETEYKEALELLFIDVLKLAQIDKQLNAPTLMLIGHEISKTFGYSTRLSEEDQIKELKEIKDKLIKLLWDAPTEDRATKITEALKIVKSGINTNVFTD